MITILKKVKHRFIFWVLWLNAFYNLQKYGREKIIFLLGTPWHGNIGDQAIALAEDVFLVDNCEKKVIEIPSQYLTWYLPYWKKLINKSAILVHGGGFIGTLWPEEDRMIKKIIASFKENKIIILPQTIYFDEKCDYDITSYNYLFEECKNITICVRERYSYEVCKKNKFPNAKLTPDMVTYLNTSFFGGLQRYDENKILLCFRNDKEKTFDSSVLEAFINSYPELHFKFTDTFVNHTIYPFNRKKEVAKKIDEFGRANIVITDRLHGMLLAALAGTPCIVFGNCNYKIIGVYEWISNNPNIIFLKAFNNIYDAFNELLNTNHIPFNNEKAQEGFEELKFIVKGL